jgi:hypothetical protein
MIWINIKRNGLSATTLKSWQLLTVSWVLFQRYQFMSSRNFGICSDECHTGTQVHFRHRNLLAEKL